MVRSDGGKRYDDFREREVAGIGFPEIAAIAKPGVDRKTLLKEFLAARPGVKEQSAIAAVSQVYRFVNEIDTDDLVVTYSPTNRRYLVGRARGAAAYHPEWTGQAMEISRPVEWMPVEVGRDQLSVTTRNTLGSVLTVFKLSGTAGNELLAIASGQPTQLPKIDAASKGVDPLQDIEALAFERIKDQINQLDWEDMQELVAGILRAMGYKTQVSPKGSDLGRDILASPDGFGFEQPRIIVEVKHRKGTMSSQDIRGFLGGRHKDDRGLYVSTGGFTKDARYEADRSSVPLTLWTLEELTKALTDNYERTDSRTKSLIALRTFYFPSDS
ncbi:MULTISPECIES: restriction endonuclease [Mycolicibacterium]|uniref:Restriction endonuclease n=1 Tax=Mycolicibacterium senegalense TaxID=1796 RepID=A0A378W6E3_9MYCO|nr:MULTISPECIES: restriction endonuclease [Mycolicibacterium]MDR7288635.1 restriction system protein [Mycolicibacterium senegalense]CDP85275.1 restriction endonuclease [Mycolicibacterium farcinogenes]SUA27791.1 restriction endonuclease [Mycolicibacterium senegalense]